ncbi:MAG: GAF domain-containing protein [Ferruginibacter sp.]
MQPARFPDEEELRLYNLLSYDILDSEAEQDFDELVELISLLCNCKYALISFMDRDRHWFKARKGISIKEQPREISFCAHTILQNEVMVICDTQHDERFFDNPNVTGKYKFAFYAGAPIISAAGYKLGTVCALDNVPKHSFSQKQKNGLRIIAKQVSALLELKVKNKQLRTQSEQQVAEEKRIVQQTLTEQDEEKEFIANELHENFAQTLAATKLYLDFAEQSKELAPVFIKKCRDNILQIIKEMKALSRSILPTTFQHANYLEFIEEMLAEYGKQNNMAIKFTHKGKLDFYDSNIGLTLFRIIQYQLRNAHNCGAKKIAITIKTDGNIKVSFVDDGKNLHELEPDRKMLLQHINTRIGLVKGHVNLSTDKKGNNRLDIEIPLVQE